MPCPSFDANRIRDIGNPVDREPVDDHRKIRDRCPIYDLGWSEMFVLHLIAGSEAGGYSTHSRGTSTLRGFSRRPWRNYSHLWRSASPSALRVAPSSRARSTIRQRARSISVVKPSRVARWSRDSSSWKKVTCHPAGPRTRALIVWKGVRVGGASSSAPFS